MPTYEYACLSCGTHVEVFQRFNEDPLTVCGVCGGPLRKVFHPAGILFKGSGFYATDSRASRAKGRSGEGEKTDTSSGEMAGSKTRSDPGTETGSKSESGSKSERGPASEGSKGDSGSASEGSRKKEPRADGRAKEKSA